MKKALAFIVIVVLTFSFISIDAIANSFYDLEEIDQEKINELVNRILNKSKVPGASIVLVSGEQTKYLQYGYSDLESGIPTQQHNLYEIGSMSKAFTALGVLRLEQEGKISIKDSVSKYLPWFNVHYKGEYDGRHIDEYVDLKLANLLHHTSGIPVSTIGYIPEGNSDDSLKKTVQNIVGIDLDYYPGIQYQYATINYDILGLIIEVVSGQKYEDYIKDNILVPLGLNDTHLFRDNEVNKRIAQGYKVAFYRAKPYDAPIYRGNTPAGYIISSADDMEKWIRIQMQLVSIPKEFKEIIEESHIYDSTVSPEDDFYYAKGWYVHKRNNIITHGGNNPNYSSILITDSDKKLGICVLTNMNSNACDYIANGILNIIENKRIDKYKSDSYLTLDFLFSTIISISIILCCLFIILIALVLIEMKRNKRIRASNKTGMLTDFILSILVTIFLGFCIYYMPNVLFERLPWEAVKVWGSPSILIGSKLGYIAFSLFMAYLVITFNYCKKHEKNYVVLISLSLINGISSAMIIFTINEAFNTNLKYTKELFVYFLCSLILFVYTTKILQRKIITITNEIIYEKRVSIIDKIVNTSYERIEYIGKERIFSGLNNDIQSISQLPEALVGFVSDLLTIVFCLGYLFVKNKYMFWASLSIIVINGTISIITGKLASKYWEKNRDIQDVFIGQITDLVNGHKEFVLNKLRRLAFWKDIKKFSRLSAELNETASVKFLNFDLYNTLMYNLVFGVVVFIFPLLILNIGTNDLRENLFIIFYMIGPFNALAHAISRITQIRVNLKRTNLLIGELYNDTTNYELENMNNYTECKDITFQFDDIKYKYTVKEENDESEFELGSINMTFHTGSITFITGGNGSGKSTLAKLITGLYTPLDGTIKINNEKADPIELNNYFSAIYSDFYLFKKLYGIDYMERKDELNELLKIMKLENKVEIDDSGNIKSLNLSTGQRKRLAFIVCCLEDKPMMLFDEWAAEQDPEFRNYFYMELLPMLKAKGKGVILISHDDRYFNSADYLIKMERGQLIETFENKNKTY